ncbi:MAG: cAMP-binding protein [Acidobacteria bacterium]|jgi:small-conductance mechanosensitive channel|nr:cAMP-binding protein [Acidobacteriota bacterium]
MPSTQLRKKTIFFAGFAGSIILILIALPFIEVPARNYIESFFGATDLKMGETATVLFDHFLRIVKIILWMILVVSSVRFLDFLIFGTAFRSSGQNEISSLLRNVFSIITFIVAFFIIFNSQYPQVDLAALFTTSTILGIVIGLALQDTLGNLFAGLAMQADQPFQVGDVISISNRGMGVVESVSWRGVKIRTFQNKLLLISNSVLGKEVIEVAPKDNLNARIVFFNTLYSHSPAKTVQVVREAVRQVENVSAKIRPVVRIRNLGDNGVDWEIKYWLEDYAKFNDTDALIRQRLWYVFQRENLEFAYPTRTIYIENKAEKPEPIESVNEIFEKLSNIPIFAPLSDEETQQLAQSGTARIYAPGEAIVHKGQQGNSMFIINRGAVKVQIAENGQPKVINRLQENDFFGEMSLLTGQPRSATVIAEEETEVLQIKKKALKPIFETNPDLVKSICQIVEERRELLKTHEDLSSALETDQDRGVLSSIKKFFGLS